MKWKTVIILGLLLIISIYLIEEAIYPAHISVSSVCFPKHFEEKFSEEYTIGGQVTFDSSGEVISVDIIQDTPEVNKHEQCHVEQIERGWLPTCRNLPLFYLAEMECYLRD